MENMTAAAAVSHATCSWVASLTGRLDQHVAVLRAMVNDGVTVADVPQEAVHAIVEVDKVA